MLKTTPHRRHRGRFATATLALGIVVLVGCAGTIDGRASVGQDLLGSIGSDPSGSPTADSSTTESSAESTPTSSAGSSDPAESSAGSAAGTDTSGTAGSTAASTSGATTSGGATSGGATPSSSTSSPSSASSSSAGTSATSAPAGPGVTAPGTQLTYGASAVLPLAYAEAEGVFTMSGLTVTRGSEADWATLGVDTSDAQGEEPWFVRLKVTQESGGDFSYTSVQDDLWAYSADNEVVTPSYPGDDANPLCPLTYAPEGFVAGQSYDACVVFAVNLGETIDHVQFEGGFDPDDPYYENPVVWKG